MALSESYRFEVIYFKAVRKVMCNCHERAQKDNVVVIPTERIDGKIITVFQGPRMIDVMSWFRMHAPYLQGDATLTFIKRWLSGNL